MTRYLPLSIICAIGIGIRLYYLNAPIGEDEAMTYLVYASQPLSQALSDYSAPNNHLFHTLLVHMVSRFGSDEWLLRLPAVIAGSLLIPAAFVLCRQLYHRNAGLFAAALMAASSPMIEYSTNARGYTLVALFATLSFWLAARWLVAPRRDTALLFVLCAALGFYTIPIMLYPFSGTLLWWCWSIVRSDRGKARRQRLVAVVSIALLTLILSFMLYLPVLLNAGVSALIGNRFVAPLSMDVFLAQYLPQFGKVAQFWLRDLLLPLPLLVVAGVVLTLRFQRRLSPYHVPLLIAVMIASVAITLIQRVAPWERVWLPLMPLVAVTAFGCLGFVTPQMPRITRALPYTAVVLCLALSAIILMRHRSAPFGDLAVERDAANIARSFADDLESNPVPSVQIVPSSASLIYYFQRYAIPQHYLADPNEASAIHVFVVVLKPEYSIDSMLDLLRQFGFASTTYGAPILVEDFDHAALYLVMKLE